GIDLAFVEFRDVRKVYTMGEVEVAAVDGMTFDIERGELVVVVGPSGAGKTTLLNCVATIDTVPSGRILVDGRDVTGLRSRALAKFRRD
ncbi:ATP-binding cassette domain-containing protein, partial [Desulfovibrio desulfuricans]|nr:ATP-binding cassette domain-containing protein [Desulfovibrio desulfuricans]